MLHSHHRSYLPLPTLLKRTVPLFILALIFSTLTITAPFASATGSAPVVYAGNQWFGGAGVNVCTNTNGGGTKDFCGTERFVGGVAGARWQCVEFAQRFYQKMNWHTGMFSGVWLAHDLYDVATQNGFSRQANGNITDIQPGDMIVHHKDAPYTGGAGHVSIVDRISGSIVYAVEQNTGSPTAAYTLSGKTLNRQGLNMIRGIVKPKDSSSNRSSGEASSLSYSTTNSGSPRVYSGSKSGKVYQTSPSFTAGPGSTQEISALPSPVRAITSISVPTSSEPDVYVGTEAGALYKISNLAGRRSTSRIASFESPILSIQSTLSPSGETFVYSGLSSGRVNVTRPMDDGKPATTQVANLNAAVTSLALVSSTARPNLFAGTASGHLHQIAWDWNETSYSSLQLSSTGSAVNAITASALQNNNFHLYSASQDGSIHQTITGNTVNITRLTRHSLPATAIVLGSGADNQPRLYSATTDGKIYQTHWNESTPQTVNFEAINGRINQIVFAQINSSHSRLFSASNNGGIYQIHWGESTKLGSIQLARP